MIKIIRKIPVALRSLVALMLIPDLLCENVNIPNINREAEANPVDINVSFLLKNTLTNSCIDTRKHDLKNRPMKCNVGL